MCFCRLCKILPNRAEQYKAPNKIPFCIGNCKFRFCCEVFLKTLLVFHGVPVEELKCHDLKRLWEKFKTKDANTALSVELGLREWFKSQNANMFDEMLNDISNAFEYWRYIYEKQEGRINLNFLVGFRDLLREVCCNQLYGKSWSEYEKGE